MKKTSVVQFKNPEEFKHDLLTEVLRTGAQQLITLAVQSELEEFISQHAHEETSDGKSRFVRNGYLPVRAIQTGIGEVDVKVPRVRDRAFEKDGVCFGSSIIPKYLRRSGDMTELLPLLYLKGLSTSDFSEALVPLVGKDAKNISPGVISRLKTKWETEYEDWGKRDLKNKKYVYLWADGIYLSARMEDAKSCVLVIIGVTPEGKKELLAIEDGFRESKDSWQSLLRNLKDRGLTCGPELAVGDGALGFWGALEEEYPEARHQRCWFHKMGNVLDKLPKSLQPKAKASLQEIWMSATREDAYKAFGQFINDHKLKYPKSVACLEKDKEKLLAFYDFPAEHWGHLRTTNPIESTFATVRHRTRKSKGCFSRTTILTMVFKLTESAEKRWRRLRGFERLGEVIEGVKFIDGIREDELEKVVQNEIAA